LSLPEFPDFLKREIQVLAEEKDDLEEDEDEGVAVEEGKIEQELDVFIEKDIGKLDRTNSLWEVQKIGAVVGDVLFTNERYLIRHVWTGMYLITSENIELGLSPFGINPENEFKFKNNLLLERQKDQIRDREQIWIQNVDDKYIQTYIDLQKEEFSYIKSRKFTTEIPIVWGYKHTRELTKEAFIIEKADYELKNYSYKAFSIYFFLLESYKFINQWGVIREEEEGEEYDKYDEVLASATEDHLQEKTESISLVLDILIRDLNNKDIDELIRIQGYYAEQGIIEMLVKLAELNYYKSTRVEERLEGLLGEKQFRAQAVRSLINDDIGEDEIRPEIIADEYLTELNDKILRVIYMMVRFNVENCNILTKYDQLIYSLKELPVEGDITR
jgi:hypothetical protein